MSRSEPVSFCALHVSRPEGYARSRSTSTRSPSPGPASTSGSTSSSTRDIAERFNSRFGETFTRPRGVYPEIGAKLMDLQQGEKKMSTTGGTEQGTVYVLDPPDVNPAQENEGGDPTRAREVGARARQALANRTSSRSWTSPTGESIQAVQVALRRAAWTTARSQS